MDWLIPSKDSIVRDIKDRRHQPAKCYMSPERLAVDLVSHMLASTNRRKEVSCSFDPLGITFIQAL